MNGNQLPLGCFVALLALAATAPAQTPAPATSTAKYCAIEPKAATKTIHSSECREYCVPRVGLLDMLRRCCGYDVECCEMKTKHVLMKQIVPGPSAPACVLKTAVCEPITQPGGTPPR